MRGDEQDAFVGSQLPERGRQRRDAAGAGGRQRLRPTETGGADDQSDAKSECAPH
jgi:hypothetical protein